MVILFCLPVGFDISSWVPNIFEALTIPERILAAGAEEGVLVLCGGDVDVFFSLRGGSDFSLHHWDQGEVAEVCEVSCSVLLHPEVPVHLGLLRTFGLKRAMVKIRQKIADSSVKHKNN